MKRVPKQTAAQLRIIGGMWRGRKLTVVNRPGLRPTGDRVRETLFNWLTPVIADAKCLDLFAGSGALGLEALSRGAASCDFVDADEQALLSIRKNLSALIANPAPEGPATALSTAADYLAGDHEAWDIVFVDPPFDCGLGEPALHQLATNARLHKGSFVYFESRRSAPEYVPEALYTVHREKTAGDVLYRLLKPRQEGR